MTTTADVIKASTLPAFDGVHDFTWGLSGRARYAVKSQIGALPPTWALFDAKGRQVRQVTDAFTSDASKPRFVFKEAEYDALGRTLRTSVPHDAGDTDIRWTTNEYDPLGRVCASTAINGLRTETLFLGRSQGGGSVIVVVDPKQQLSMPPPAAGGPPVLSCGHPFSAALYRSDGLDQPTSSVVNMRKQMIELRMRSGA